MAAPTLLVDVAFALATAGVYTYVARVTSRRRVEGGGRLALEAFSIWWYALAAITASSAITRTLAYLGVLDIGIHSALLYASILILCVAFWALLYYLAYVYSGDRRWLAPITAFYAAAYIFLLYSFVLRHPIGVEVGDWRSNIVYEREFGRDVRVALLIVFIVPPILGAIAYARLFFAAREPTQRYRIGLVSFTIVAWFSSSLIASATGLSDLPWWHFASRTISLSAALIVLAAYRPPAWIRARWHVRGVDDPERGVG